MNGCMDAARVELKRTFGYDEFRPGQGAAIESILSGSDLFAILPTGGGKSICYQIPALVMQGVTVVISPLISLMKDQVDQLTQLGVEARALNSSVDTDSAREIMREARTGRIKMLYIAPERLEFESCRNDIWNCPVAMVVIDEAHCVSQWGHDFRPSYMNIGAFIEGFAKRPIVAAFTATATENVSSDILKLLDLKNPKLVKTGFDRPNLEFSVVRMKKAARAAYIQKFIDEHAGESGIIYCSSRKDTENLAEEIGGLCYHAGMDDEARRRAQDEFINDENCVICATNAFGMGIDKPNVRYVLHYHMPASVEAYWQEAGRAGRDGLAAECVLLCDGNDVNFWNQMINRDEGDDSEKDKRRQRLRTMAGYMFTRECLRKYLVGYFGEKIDDCGACSNCCGGSDTTTDTDITREAQMILSAIKRSGERLGAAMISRILYGSRDRRIIELGLDQQSTYGIMRNTERSRIKEYIDELISQRIVDVREGQYPVLKLNAQSVEVLRGERTVMARIENATAEEYENVEASRRTRAKSSRKARNADMQYYGTPLFERLRALRKKIAEEKGVPAFVVMGDVSLVDMAKYQPRTPAEFLNMNGVGEHKLKQYGARFLAEINAYIAETTGNGNGNTRTANTNAFMSYLSGRVNSVGNGAGAAPPGVEAYNRRVSAQQQIADERYDTQNELNDGQNWRDTGDEHMRRQKRMTSDLILFLRTHRDDFLSDFPEYSANELESLIQKLRE